MSSEESLFRVGTGRKRWRRPTARGRPGRGTMRCAFQFFPVWILAALVHSACGTIFVNGSASVDLPGCGGPGSPCRSTRYAVEVVAPLEVFPTIAIAPGTYSGSGYCDIMISEPMHIVGAGAETTVLDCPRSRAFLAVQVDGTVAFSNFSITNGYVDDNSSEGANGGGILVSWTLNSSWSPLLPIGALFDGLVITNCSANSVNTDGEFTGGGGLAVLFGGDGQCNVSDVLVSNSQFVGNTVHNPTPNPSVVYGAGLLIGSLSTALEWVNPVITVSNCTFVNQTALGGYWGEGGGLAFVLDSVLVDNYTIVLDGILVEGNKATYGGGVYLEMDIVAGTGSVTLSSSVVNNNTALEDGGGFYVENYSNSVVLTEVLVVDSNITNNIALEDGGGLFFHPFPPDPVNQTNQNENVPTWIRHMNVNVTGCLIAGNSLLGSYGNGGGVSITDGGSLRFEDTAIVGNTGQVYGGGVYLAAISSEVFFSGDCFLANNSVVQGGGEQFVTFSLGSVGWEGLRVDMNYGASQVIVQNGGYVYLTNSTQFTCPFATLFHDFYNGLYDGHWVYSYEPGWYALIRVSTLLFECQYCGSGEYAYGAGFSSGQPRSASNPTCYGCPYGGTCTSTGSVVAAPGYWGTNLSSGEVVFSQCPAGYCCADVASCTSIQSCAGHRAGQMCGACEEGYVETLGSAACRLASKCNDGPWFWIVSIVGLLLAGAVMLRSSEMWCFRRHRPFVRVKLVSYFFQMLLLVTIPFPNSSALSSAKTALDNVFSIFKLQFPFQGVGTGACVSTTLTVPMKLSLGYVIPVVIGVAMGILYAVGKVVEPPIRRHISPHVHAFCLKKGTTPLPSPTRRLSTPSLNTTLSDVERVKAGLMTWFLFSYAAILTASLELLACVKLRGKEGTYLFLDANIQCETAVWRGPVIILTVLVSAFPFVLPLISWRVRSRVGESSGLHRVLCQPYKDRFYWWETVLISQRLILSFLSSFLVQYPVVRMAVTVFVCFLYAAAHLILQPMNNRASIWLQNILQMCLLLVACCNLIPARDSELGVLQSQVRFHSVAWTSGVLLDVMQLVFAYLCPLVAVIGSFFIRYERQLLLE